MAPGEAGPVDPIIDPSVGVKWPVPEAHSDEASRLLLPGVRGHVPTLFLTEVSQAIGKKARLRNESTPDEGREIIESLPALPLERHPTETLHVPSFGIALQAGRSVYDSVYLALAMATGWKFVTADERLFDTLKGHPIGSTMLRVADIPGRSHPKDTTP